MSDLVVYNPESAIAVSQADTDGELIELWLRTKASKYTRAEYKRDIETFRRAIEGRELRAVKLVDLQDYADSLLSRSPNTRRRMLSSLKSLLSFARKIGYLQFDVGAALSLPRAKNVLPERILTEEQVMTMIVAEGNQRNQLLLHLLYVSGGRISEVAGLRWRDFQAREGGGQVTLFGKGDKTRVVRLPAKLWADLEAVRSDADHFVFHRRGWPGKGLNVSQIRRIVYAAAKRAGVTPGVSPHWLRHSMATHSLERGANIALVAATLGHSDVQITSKYLHARPSDSASLYLVID